MFRQETESADEVPLWRRVPTGLWVVVALQFLLHGPRQAVVALWNQAVSLLAAFLGGEGVVLAVLGQTAPLAVATAVIVFACRQQWITFESTWSLLVCAGILISGASIGAELRGFLQRTLPGQEHKALASADAVESPPGSVTLGWLMQRTHPKTNQLGAHDAWRAATNWEYITALGAGERWPDRVPRVALLPEQGSWLGIVGKAANQLLGYLVFYRPRMFLAALLVGGYLGWAWHRHYTRAEEQVIEWTNELNGRHAA